MAESSSHSTKPRSQDRRARSALNSKIRCRKMLDSVAVQAGFSINERFEQCTKLEIYCKYGKFKVRNQKTSS